MSQSAKAQEPSMEEILASIRRIISDDDAARPAPAAAKPAPEPAPAAAATVVKNSQDDIDAMLASFDAADDDDRPDEAPPAKAQAPADVFELTESMEAGAVSNGVDRSADGAFDKPPGPERPRSPEASRTMPMPDRTLLSPRTTAAVDTAFNSLAHAVLMQNSRTLEDLVREMLKPMLKAWLDDNLPNMVERLVRAEIERVSRGRG
jgi:cell pole-organizing protein PopZ